jgi:hypothetical protein
MLILIILTIALNNASTLVQFEEFFSSGENVFPKLSTEMREQAYIVKSRCYLDF